MYSDVFDQQKFFGTKSILLRFVFSGISLPKVLCQQSFEMTVLIVTWYLHTLLWPVVDERLPNASNILLVWSPCVAMDGDKKDESAIPGIVTEVMLEASCLKC